MHICEGEWLRGVHFKIGAGTDGSDGGGVGEIDANTHPFRGPLARPQPAPPQGSARSAHQFQAGNHASEFCTRGGGSGATMQESVEGASAGGLRGLDRRDRLG